jgi:hypothetical protein
VLEILFAFFDELMENCLACFKAILLVHEFGDLVGESYMPEYVYGGSGGKLLSFLLALFLFLDVDDLFWDLDVLLLLFSSFFILFFAWSRLLWLGD